MYGTSGTTSTYDIRDAVDLGILQRIQDSFARALEVAALIVDARGTPITNPSEFTPMCRMIRSTSAGFKRCMGCDSDGGREARDLQGPYVYVCKGGLTDIAAPIIIEGRYLGSAHIGQILPSDSWGESVEEVIRRNDVLSLPKDDLRGAAGKIPAMPRSRIDAAAEMLFLLSNYIVAMGIANLTQRKLFEEAQSRVALQMELQRAQLHMLQSQINPQFFFNAIGIVGRTSRQGKAPQTEPSACYLRDIVRYTLRNAEAPVTVGKELEVIERYLEIQRLRMNTSPRQTAASALLQTKDEVRLPTISSPSGLMSKVRGSDPGDRVIEQAIEYIVQNQHRADLELKDVARAVYLSPSHLEHLFKAKTGVSYIKYLTALRIEKAKRLLATTEMTVTAVAEAIGYEDQAYFHRVFRRQTGTTPKTFRRGQLRAWAEAIASER